MLKYSVALESDDHSLWICMLAPQLTKCTHRSFNDSGEANNDTPNRGKSN